MPLEKAIKSLPFVEGPDSKVDPKISAKPSLLYDAVFRRGSVAKRWGRTLITTNLGFGANLTSGEALFPFNQELVRINGGNTYGLVPMGQIWEQKPGGGHYSTIKKQSLIHNNASQLHSDQVVVNGVAVLAWAETATSSNNPGIHIAVYDVASGIFYQSGISALAGTSGSVSPRCVAIGNRVVILFCNPSITSLLTSFVDTTTPTTAPAVEFTIKPDFYTGGITFDAIPWNSSYAVVAYPSAATSITLLAVGPDARVAASPATNTVTSVVATALSGGIYLATDPSNNIYVVAANVANGAASATVYFCTNASLVTITGITTIVSGASSWSGQFSDFVLATSYFPFMSAGLLLIMTGRSTFIANTPQWLGTAIIGADGNVKTAFSEIPGTQGLVIVSDITPYDGTQVFGVENIGTYSYLSRINPIQPIIGIQSTAFIVSFDGANVKPVARALSGTSGISTTGVPNGYRVSRTSSFGNGVSILFPEQGPFEAGGQNSAGGIITTTPLGISQLQLTKANAGQLTQIQVGKTVYYGGALPGTYDGVSMVESGFSLFPNVALSTVVNSGGNLSTGTYSFSFVWAWYNSQGELTRSIPAPPPVINGIMTNYLLIYKIATDPLSTRDNLPSGITVFLEVYRTLANGTVFYSQTDAAIAIGGTIAAGNIGTNQLSFSGTTSGLINITDLVSDANLQGSPLLYTTGGVLDWEPPPPYSAACAHNNRLIVISSENPFSWWPSSEWAPRETVRFSSQTINFVPSDKGPLVACASMDGKLILFAQNGAYLVYGDGPDLLGNNNYPAPQAIVSIDAGPVASQSVITTPLGIMYQGPQGIALLDRGLNYQFIGTDVERWSTGAWQVRNAILDAQSQEVRFQADTGSDVVGMQAGTLVPSDGAVTLVYNYLYNQWSVFTYGGQAQTLYNGNMAIVQSNGACWQEAPGTFRDNGAYYPSIVELPWLKLAGLQGFQRLWYASLLGTYASDFTLTWQVAYDYSSSSPDVPLYSEIVQLVGNGLFTLEGPFRARHHLGHKCEAVKFLISDGSIGGSGEGMSLSELSLEYGIRKGAFKLPVANTL
jgi:hypothetical protein